jgi:hypothetical protein
MSSPGLLFVIAYISNPNKSTDEQFNKFYNEEHLPDVLNYKTKITSLALRYKETNAEGPPAPPQPPRTSGRFGPPRCGTENPTHYLALYPLEDISFFSSGIREQLREETKHSKTYNGENVMDFVHFDARPYKKIQTYEGYGHADKTGKERGQTITCVAMEPAEGAEAEADFDAWYRKQHLDMLAMCEGYRRTTRYERVDGEKPRFLALHEWACKPEDLPTEQIEQVAKTEWSLKILSEAEVKDRDVFELIEAQGDLEMKL